ncbi:hypothetical protein MAL08_00670 [Leptospira noguchii]|uniref:hypothetical protein n=1 Tax=Leptospira noguchii TaxID=28182 RepID=UPI0002BE68B6|nr:hypothetical protein [Leptospira noguchii]EMI72544.1 hypothetical protein LEP1GSC072_0936 [Leptospira noguchii str. Bonito]EMS81953.1 hypothetical protein LEP1GSC073_1139 [Leptospira noguchii str. Cascata]UOG37928.1 hypothetical protein MAL08_00670 [Leptospira noguchii]
MKIGGEYRVQLGIPRDESLYYIGHGQLESAPASTSVLHVISHELGHVAEFKSEAIRDRAEIRSLNMKIHYEFRNGKLVAVAGETEVITAKKPEETSHKSNEISKQDSWKEKDLPKKEETSKTKSEDREKQILSEIRRIESELKIFETKKNGEKESDSIRKTELEEKKRKLEMVLSQEKLKAVLKDTMDTFRELMDKQTRMSLKIFNTNVSDKLGNFLDAKV